MARSPSELMTKVAEEDKCQADKLEARIDAEMDKLYRGGTFDYVTGNLREEVFAELKRRYGEWDLTMESVNLGPNESGWRISFTPKSDPRSSPLLDRL